MSSAGRAQRKQMCQISAWSATTDVLVWIPIGVANPFIVFKFPNPEMVFLSERNILFRPSHRRASYGAGPHSQERLSAPQRRGRRAGRSGKSQSGSVTEYTLLLASGVSTLPLLLLLRDVIPERTQQFVSPLGPACLAQGWFAFSMRLLTRVG